MTTERPRHRPLPRTDFDLDPFWEGCRKHELLLQRCKNCGTFNWHPRRWCGNCWTDNSEWVKSPGKGVVYTYSVIRQAGHSFFREKLPYIVGYVELDEGVRMMTNFIDIEPEQMRIGMPVEVTFEDVLDDFSVPLFRPRPS
jgi:uncharacterized OB-fold protein